MQKNMLNIRKGSAKTLKFCRKMHVIKKILKHTKGQYLFVNKTQKDIKEFLFIVNPWKKFIFSV
ncbi:hypothetical protein BpHYR1_041484 [Brachionus plicatilis]|uniref:Uncharacterized protein n=1 Tax=Brachionus plicatilis TaxID=10195 RepID=A0A3M7RVX6_BRAPC|nr:hypothetical protein BpHYR1_041484 [Brachionus plicatilis]